MELDEFRDLFEEEHHWVEKHIRDLLTGLDEFKLDRVHEAIDRLNIILGPHFRYEEEALYPALKEVHGRIYVKRLYDSHEGTIHTIRKFNNQLENNELGRGSVPEARDLVNGWLLPHVSDCEGLSIVFEDLSKEQINNVCRIRNEALNDGINLLEWADSHRERPEFGTLSILDS